MAIDFSAFDNKVDLAALQKEVEEAKDTDFADVPDGKYIVSIEKMEIKLTKAQDKLMFAVQCKIKEGEQANRMIFFTGSSAVTRSAKHGMMEGQSNLYAHGSMNCLVRMKNLLNLSTIRILQTRFLMYFSPFRTLLK